MTVQKFFRNRSDIGFLDYLLTGAGAMLAVYSAGLAINEEAIGLFMTAIVALGTLSSYLIRRTAEKSVFLKIDGVLYAVIAIAAVFSTRQLNTVLPGSGFPMQLAMAGVLCWMLALCSFSTWRDGTLLFQAIPSIALFGLVGCYDTFRNVTFTFFGFLICLATLFARAHARDMLQQASASGYFGQEAARLNRPPVEESSEMFDQIKSGPWRWIAGPEWALASALVIILVSLLGAPVIQESVKGVSGFVTLPTPVPRSSPNTSAGATSPSGNSAQIGRGPNQLRDIVLYEAQMDEARYLRTATYDDYNGTGWTALYSRGLDPAVLSSSEYTDVTVASIEAIQDPVEIEFEIKAVVPTRVAPVPGELLELENRESLNQKSDGTFEASGLSNLRLHGRSLVPSQRSLREATSKKADMSSSLARTLNYEDVPVSVIKWAQEVSKDGTNDREKAELLRSAIANQVKYNLRASAVPTGRDPVEYFLFESKEGYCDLYASSMTLGARAIGIPARYVVGFLPDDAALSGQSTYIVRERDAHAWSELFFEGVGWVVFDATTGSPSVENAGPGDGTEESGWWQRTFAQYSLVGIAVILLVVGAWLSFARRPISNEQAVLRRELDKAYGAYAKLLTKASGHRRQLGQTPSEFLSTARDSLGESYPLASSINAVFVNAMYSANGLDSDGLEKLRREIEDLKTSLKSNPSKEGKKQV